MNQSVNGMLPQRFDHCESLPILIQPQVWLSVLLLGLLLAASLVVLPDIRHMPRENSDSAR